jgi:hypothetical protein
MEHRAQTMLYTLLLEDRYGESVRHISPSNLATYFRTRMQIKRSTLGS